MTTTHHADVSYQISILFKKVFPVTLYCSSSLISYTLKWKQKELERRAFVRKTMEMRAEERE